MNDSNRLGPDAGWAAIRGSFYSDDKNLTNAIHIVHSKKRERTEIATGLIMLTYPVKRRD